MHPRKPEGSTFVDKTWGYVMEKHGGKWMRQHRLVMERELGRKLRRGEVVHHKNGDRADNRPENLELMSEFEHRSHHSGETGRHTDETRRKISESAKRYGNDPMERHRRSQRAKRQHAERRFGY